MTEVSQNGWSVIFDEDQVRQWNIPTDEGTVILPFRPERAGFLLCHYILWHSEAVEPVFGQGDDFGWYPRKISGSDEWSNHASATAGDLNASKHPSGVRATYSKKQTAKIRKRLATRYSDLIKWGGDFRSTVDEMHFELIGEKVDIYKLAESLVDTDRGRRIIESNMNLGAWAD